MPHPLVTQLRFARGEFERVLTGLTAEDAVKRVPPMNCLSWIIGHLAAQESSFWVFLAQEKIVHGELRALTGYGSQPNTPPLDEMWAAWREVTQCADAYLDTLTVAALQTHFIWQGKPLDETIGTLLQRNLYHYWYHIGEAAGIRQALGHTGLPEFVGDLGGQAPYRPEA